jgi:hypothetical protein
MSPTDDPSDELLEALLAAAGRDVPPPDAAFLERLREQSTQAFLASAPTTLPLRPRRRFMNARTLRALAASAAALLVATAALFWYARTEAARPTFGKALGRLAQAQSVHLEVTQKGETYDVWAAQPGRLRRNAPDGTYEIAIDGKLWQVDEKANRATVRPSPYHRPQLDLLALLPIPGEAAGALAEQRPVGRAVQEGVECLVYQMALPSGKDEVEVEALVERATGLPRSVRAQAVRDGRVEVLAALSVLAYDEAVSEETFVVRPTLTEDGRAGTLTDSQGVVAVKPALRQRWTPVAGQLMVKPGDWVRTDPRGANAATLRLVPRTRVIVGPGSTVEVAKPDEVRLLEGQVEVSSAKGAPVTLLGHGDQKVVVEGTRRFRSESDKLPGGLGGDSPPTLREMKQEPLWLKAFKGKTSNESIGSLIAGVDGRNVPLTVGEHKVTVDIRDQIARTTIEETFVNHTAGVLEGVFHFPLPEGASISGFAMWIGDQMVEADVVEKQRAREIYEIILQEKRDPGLLEWTGGNIFKARVYPIFGHSEKRVRITYTQVLPLRAGSYRYSYALQSELLQQNPLRELAIDVRLSSAVPLRNVTCPTHMARIDQARGSAHVAFAAQQYMPSRDFEVVIEPQRDQQGAAGGLGAVLIPHRRGDDGYFMLQLAAPADDANERALLGDGRPLNLLLLADTSASMDAGQRKAQAAFLSALLAAVTPRDTLNVAACDVECDWVFEKPVPATPSHLAAAREFLARRTSLGWTDLDRAIASALERSGPDTHIVYVGDGIHTAGDGDAAELAKRLRLLHAEKGKQGVTCHAVTTGSSYEAAVLRSIASLGSGSLRHISAAEGPAAVALELLGEITAPPVRDLKVELRALRTARVYPEHVPNLAAGTQQVLVGRYLPEGRDQVGEVVVTGTRGGQPVRFSAQVKLADAEKGNSFIPRLWARMHLDHLLARGGPGVRDEIIALSEEYNILTPYTSLLVLESDADRERFKVKTRFRMRDGERFFAQGRDNASYELKQRQMKRAGEWRLGLHRGVLARLARLGRVAPDQRGQRARARQIGKDLLSLGLEDDVAGVTASTRSESETTYLGDLAARELVDAEREAGDEPGLDKSKKKSEVDERFPEAAAAKEDAKALDLGPDGQKKDGLHETLELDDDAKEAARARSRPDPWGEWAGRRERMVDEANELGAYAAAGGLVAAEEAPAEPGYFGRMYRYTRGNDSRSLAALFPDLPAAPAGAANTDWPEAARALARGLLRAEKLAKVRGGVEVVVRKETLDPRWNEPVSRSGSRTLLSGGAWLMRTEGDGEATLVRWCDGRGLGVLSRAFGLGSVRAASAADLAAVPLDLGDHSLSGLERAFGAYTATLEPRQDGQVLLLLQPRWHPTYQTRVLADTKRRVVLQIEVRAEGKTTSVATFDDFVEVAGCWWPRRVETRDGKGKVTARTSLTVRALDGDEMAAKLKEGLAERDTALLRRLPMRSFTAVRKAEAGGKATFDDHFALLLHFAASQRWAQARKQLERCEALAAGKPGVRFLQYEFLDVSRRHEELRGRLLDEARRLAKATPAPGDDVALAQYLVGKAGSHLEAGEQLGLLDLLRPIYARQAAPGQGLKLWLQHRAAALDRAGRPDETLRVRKELATGWPRDRSLQAQYARALADGGDHPGAYAWLERALAGEPRWLPHEEETLRSTHAALLESQGRLADLAEYLAGWVKKDPADSSPYAQYLSALIRSDRLDQANALIARWLREGQTPTAPSPAAAARLQAAVSAALGQVHGLYSNRVEERWLPLLAEAARFFLRHEARLSDASMILGSWQFRQTEEGRRAQKAILARLASEAAILSPAQAEAYLQWVSGSDAAPDVWKRMGERLRQRWAKEADPARKHTLGQAVLRVLSWLDDPAPRMAFLRERLKGAPEGSRDEYAAALFNELLAQPWSAELEGEAFALLGQLSVAPEPGQRLRAQAAALQRLTDRMVEARREANVKAIQQPEKLTRTELRKKQEEALRLARTAVADRLRDLAEKERGPLAPWLRIEQLYLDVRLGRDLDKAAAACWDFLGDKPKPAPRPGVWGRFAPNAAAEELDAAGLVDWVLRERYLTTVMHLAARKSAAAGLVDRVLSYLDRGAELDDEAGYYRQRKYWMLVALDRPKELEQALQAWVRAGDSASRWRLALGYVLAEQGRVPEAIKTVEAIEKTDDLGPAAYRVLADWYLAANRREQHKQAERAVYQATDEYQLYRMLYARLRGLQRRSGGAPTQVDRETLVPLAVLFEKASSPQSYQGVLREYYQLTRDFRLLAVMADAVVGHTAAGVYPFLSGIQSLLSEVGDEATVDELVRHLDKVRARVKSTVDRRALDLLEVLVRRRAAELKNQGGVHADAALAALKRAFKGEWSPGEPRLMADVLANLGRVPQGPLAAEQLRQLEALRRREAEGSFDRLHVAQRFAETLAAYGRTEQAVALLEPAVAEYQQASGGALPVQANPALNALLAILEGGRQFRRGEELLTDQLRRPANAQQRHWLTARLNQLYRDALAGDGEVSLGKGQKLYQALEKKLRNDLDTPEPAHRYELVNQLCGVYTTAHQKSLAGVQDDLKAFAAKRLPEVLRHTSNYYQSIVNQVAHTARYVLGPVAGIEVLLDQIERQPAWLRFTGQDGWSHFSWTLAVWREEAKSIGALEKRLLPLVLAELRRDLESGQSRSRVMYARQNSYYWAEKEADFARVAEEVLAARPEVESRVVYIAEYFRNGLSRTPRAIEILQAAHQRQLLGEGAQAQLAQYLQEQNRHAEAIPLLTRLVERRPESLPYRVQLMRAYFHTAREADLRALLKSTDTFFHQKDRWTEGALAALALSCLENKLYAESAAYYTELVARHQRSQPGRGVGDGTLATYYSNLARAYSGLGRTAEAVDAAGGAIVAWGPTHQNRAQALEALRQVLREANNLDAYVGTVDQQAAASGRDSAVIRKALGQAYLDRGALPRAATQLRLALELQPNDAETHRLLIDCLNRLNDGKAVILALLDAAQVLRRDIALYKQLGDRLAGQPPGVWGRFAPNAAQAAERAYTSIVEALPSESESHAMLAEVRQNQGRWPEAITQWEQVARIRALEPTGLLKLAAAQVHERRWDEAALSVARLKVRAWPARFGDVGGEVRKLEAQIQEGKAAGKRPSGG